MISLLFSLEPIATVMAVEQELNINGYGGWRQGWSVRAVESMHFRQYLP